MIAELLNTRLELEGEESAVTDAERVIARLHLTTAWSDLQC
jgi:hypothetical protein